jgi:hypothetical protein
MYPLQHCFYMLILNMFDFLLAGWIYFLGLGALDRILTLNVQVGGEGGIRTHVGALAPHPISSRCRYGHFGTSPGVMRARIIAYLH